MDDLTDRDITGFKARLEAMRAELTSLLDAAASSSATVVLDQSSVGRLSRMDALQSQALAQDAERRRKIELQRIDAALGRIAAGDYGYCLNCGEEIPIARLEFDPAIAICVDCAH
jgi:DnaK suppressor protein